MVKKKIKVVKLDVCKSNSKSSSLFLNELQKERKIIDFTKDITNKLFNDCINYIKLINKNGTTNYLYKVPHFLVGYPLYDISSITIKINDLLKKQGLNTVYYPPDQLYINWK